MSFNSIFGHTPSQRQALQLAADLVAAGAGGVVLGRNAIQVPDLPAFQQALCDVVKRGVEPDAAAQKYRLAEPEKFLVKI